MGERRGKVSLPSQEFFPLRRPVNPISSEVVLVSSPHVLLILWRGTGKEKKKKRGANIPFFSLFVNRKKKKERQVKTDFPSQKKKKKKG